MSSAADEVELTNRFRGLFLGREDAYGAVHGESVKKPLRFGHWREHLFGGGSLGIYPLIPAVTHGDHGANGTPCELTCRKELRLNWGCSDIDIENLSMARNLWKVLRALGVVSWVERTKSKGYHVWVFVTEPMEPEPMRNALLVAHEVAGVPPREVNPKQTQLAHLKGGLGNYVNLPYAKTFADEGKRVVLDMAPEAGAMALRLEAFLDEAEGMCNEPERIREAAKLYVPPKQETVDFGPIDDARLGYATAQLNKLGWHIFQHGPIDGLHRSEKLAQLAHLCRESHLQAPDALLVLVDADKRWGKFSEREDCMDQLEKLVVNAYSR